jgi:hypothetical protein
MSTKSDIEKQLEAIFGVEAVQLIQLIQPVATSTVSEGLLIEKNLIVATPNKCSPIDGLLDVAGFSRTGSDGKSLFRLTDFLCPVGSELFIQPINVVATPLSDTPCFLTVVHSLLNNGADVEIKVSTWDASGAAAPNVAFNWRCRVRFQPSGGPPA